jgi:hypothetical protein
MIGAESAAFMGSTSPWLGDDHDLISDAVFADGVTSRIGVQSGPTRRRSARVACYQGLSAGLERGARHRG